MYGKPYHKMPVSSWMVPGGNRDKKRQLMMSQKYPMKSAIQKNLGGPLSEVFFSCLSTVQQDHIGYTPKLKGPGRDMWVPPSDILIGKVILTPPYTSRLRQALTHRGIMEMGAEIEAKVHKKHELKLELALEEKEREMILQIDHMIKEAVDADRLAQQLINDHILEKATSDLTKSFQVVLAETVAQLLEEGIMRMEEAVEKTKKEMEEELCQAVNSRSDYLGKQFEFQLAWRESELLEKYEIQLKKHCENCTVAMEKAQKDFVTNIKRTVAKLEAEHISDLLIQASEQSKYYHEEKNEVENSFQLWFMSYFDDEIIDRDFIILELEDSIRNLKEKCEKREDQLREVFRHFQKFINFALKEKPGQAEFLLSLDKELKKQKSKVQTEDAVETIARLIIEYIVKIIDDSSKEARPLEHKKKPMNFTIENFRNKIQKERENLRSLQVVGEENLSLEEVLFKRNEARSLLNMFEKSPSMVPMFNSTSFSGKIEPTS